MVRTVSTQRTGKELRARLAISMFLIIFGGFSWFLPCDLASNIDHNRL